MISSYHQWIVIVLISLCGMFSVQADRIAEPLEKGVRSSSKGVAKSETESAMPELLTSEEKAALGGYCEVLRDQALESELTPDTAPLLFDTAGELIPERKIQLTLEYMEGLTTACGSNVLAYTLKSAKKEGAPVLVIEQLHGDPTILNRVDRRIIAAFKSCVGNVGTKYGIQGTEINATPEAQRLKVANWFIEQCEKRYIAGLSVAESERSQRLIKKLPS